MPKTTQHAGGPSQGWYPGHVQPCPRPRRPACRSRRRGPPSSRLTRPPPTPPQQPQQHRASSGAWSAHDDQQLVGARMQGLNWGQIRDAYFPAKTANACRKRHERLMECKGADDWDHRRLQQLAREYMNLRREIWGPLAARTGEKWSVVEQKPLPLGSPYAVGPYAAPAYGGGGGVGGVGGHGYSSSVSSTASAAGRRQFHAGPGPGGSPYLNAQRMSTVADMGIGTIINRPGGGGRAA